MNDEEKAKEAAENLVKEPQNNMPEGLEVFEPKNDGLVKNINQQEDDKQFVAKDIGYSQNTEEKKNERYTGPVTQAHYDSGEMSQSYNSSNTEVHKSHATRNKKLTLIILVVVIALVVGAGYYLSTRDSSSVSSQSSNSIAQQEASDIAIDNSLESKSERDNERKTDINTMYQKLEEYYNSTGFYPKDLNSTTLIGIETEAMIDPSGIPVDSTDPKTAETRPVSPYNGNAEPVDSGAQYTYQPYVCTATVEDKHCSKYVLSSWQELGTSQYEKESLN